MKFKYSFITIKSKTKSQPNRPVIYTDQVPSYTEENQNILNLNNVYRIRGPYSSYSVPLKFLKKKQSNLQKTTSESSEEVKLKQKIQKLKAQENKQKARMDALYEQYTNCSKLSEEAVQRGDKYMMDYWAAKEQRCLRFIQETGKMIDRIIAHRRQLKQQLQKLQDSKI